MRRNAYGAQLAVAVLVTFACGNSVYRAKEAEAALARLDAEIDQLERNVERSNAREAFWRGEAERLAVAAGLALPLHQPDPIEPDPDGQKKQ